MTLPSDAVVDTNVAVTANGHNDGASPACVAASARALRHVMSRARVYIDDGRGRSAIVAEYRANLSAKGQPGAGDVFLKWILTHEWGGRHVTRVKVTPKKEDPDAYEELPEPTDGTSYDRSDRKFLAVAAAHPSHPEILQALDSKWWGWQSALHDIGVTIRFLCREEIARKYDEKMRS
jgi:hypothetical protein